MKRAVFLDRDGVINKAFVMDGIPYPPKCLSEVEILNGVKEAISIFKASNLEVVVITNQPDVSRGIASLESVQLINNYLSEELNITNLYICFHDDSEGCTCRKPKPGLLLRAAKDLKLDLARSFLIGDRWRDIYSGQAVGCKCFFIDYNYKEESPVLPFKKVSSLIEASGLIMEEINAAFN